MVELALTPDRKWNAAPADLVAASAAVGFTGLGINARDVDDSIVEAYGRAGLRCHELLVLWVDGAPDTVLDAAAQLVPAAERIGAEWILTALAGDGSDELLTALQRSAAMFAEVGAGMAVEFTPEGPVTTIDEGLEVVRAVQPHGRAGLLIDTWHFTMGESSWEDLEGVPVDEIAYIQFDDVVAPVSESFIAETLHRRAVPGDGVADLDRFATTLLERGWDGTVSVEVLNAELRERPLADIVQTLYDASAPYWR